jgi:hypothetical protein
VSDFRRSLKVEEESLRRLSVRFIPTLCPLGLEKLPKYHLRGDFLHGEDSLEFKATRSCDDEFWFEEWSNIHIKRRGWSHTCCADYLIFHQLFFRRVFAFEWPILQEWYLDNGRSYPTITSRDIGCYQQRNLTIFRRVPLSHIREFILAECDE